jgi:hypothetical protein
VRTGISIGVCEGVRKGGEVGLRVDGVWLRELGLQVRFFYGHHVSLRGVSDILSMLSGASAAECATSLFGTLNSVTCLLSSWPSGRHSCFSLSSMIVRLVEINQ